MSYRGPYRMWVYYYDPDMEEVRTYRTKRDLERETRRAKRFSEVAYDDQGIGWDTFDAAAWARLKDEKPALAERLYALEADAGGAAGKREDG